MYSYKEQIETFGIFNKTWEIYEPHTQRIQDVPYTTQSV